MFELPECLTLARQMNDTLKGKIIQRGELGNSPHKEGRRGTGKREMSLHPA